MITVPLTDVAVAMVALTIFVMVSVVAVGYFWVRAVRNESDAIKWRQHDTDYCDEREAQSRMNDLMNRMQRARTIGIR